MSTGRIGNLWRARTHRRRTAFVSVIGLVVLVGALWFPVSALSHDASDFFLFARATHGPAADPGCDDANQKHANFNGSTNTIEGRIHSNSDIEISGQNNDFLS